jgi:ABC-2 type transport system ATP-binding protein
MDEAERCHRISYISYGKLLATGTVDEVVRKSGLSTFVVRGPGVANAAQRIAELDGVEQVASFGAALHVVGSDGERLRASLATLNSGLSVEGGETSLEDVFIQFMGQSMDNGS